jgi:hypothetical protein
MEAGDRITRSARGEQQCEQIGVGKGPHTIALGTLANAGAGGKRARLACSGRR